MSTANAPTARNTGRPRLFGAGAAFARLHPKALLDAWTLGAVLAAALVATPIATVLVLALSPELDVWRHLASTVLPHYVTTTLGLMVGVGFGTAVIGVGTAWLTTMCRFPGRRVFEWALLLPLAMPAYVVAYVYTDVLEYAGPVQGLLRDLFGWQLKSDYWFPEIRSLGGAIFVMTLTLYPYVYLLARAAFLEQSVCVLEVSRTLGRTPWRAFREVALPLARPAIVIGLSLVLMETLNDFGTVDYFAVATFTAGIFDVWLNMNNRAGAAQLASVLLIFVLVLIALERFGRRKQRFHHTTTKYRALPGFGLSGWRATGAVAACATPLALGFVLPAAILLNYARVHYAETLEAEYAQFVANSLGLSAGAALLAVAVGTFLAYGVRLRAGTTEGGALKTLARFASLGYAIPGAVLAIGVIIPLALLDNTLDALWRGWVGVGLGLLLSGTVVALLYGYVVRFLALSFGTVEASLGKVTASMDGAARTLGKGPAGVLRQIHLPIMRGSILTAALLVFVDCMKELPMTMILRPFNFQTLATFVHQYASDELLAESALAALTIVAAGIVPVILLSRTIRQSRPGQKTGKNKGQNA